MRILIIGALLAGVPNAGASETDPAPLIHSEMTGKEIDAYNEGRALTDPAYIKCRRIPETGSLVKKNRVCRTNAQWIASSDKGNLNARDTMETLARGWSNSVEPQQDLMRSTDPR
jgi:hypothetical protein